MDSVSEIRDKALEKICLEPGNFKQAIKAVRVTLKLLIGCKDYEFFHKVKGIYEEAKEILRPEDMVLYEEDVEIGVDVKTLLDVVEVMVWAESMEEKIEEPEEPQPYQIDENLVKSFQALKDVMEECYS